MLVTAQILRFGLVGALATLVHVAVASALLAFAGQWQVWLVNFVAFSVAFWVSFFGHRYFTFRAPGSPARFLGAALTGLAVNNGCLALALWATGQKMISITLAAIAAPAVVFMISRLWVFR